MTYTVRVTMRLTDLQADRLARESIRLDRSTGAIMRNIIDQHFSLKSAAVNRLKHLTRREG